MRIVAFWAFLCGVTAIALPTRAFEPASTGIVLLHGKWGSASQMRPLDDALSSAGFLVEHPEMPWSGQHLFDAPFQQGLDDIARAAGRLREKGAQRIVIIGQSLGANAALHFDATGADLAAVVLIAPGHYPEGRYIREKAADSIAKAQEMVANGRGNETASFISLNDGDRNRPIQAKASDYLSYYAPDGAAMSLAAAKVGPAPILWVKPSLDKAQAAFGNMVRPRLPTTTPFDEMEVTSSHGDAPQAAKDMVVAWLKEHP